MKKNRYLIKNMGLLTIGQFATKILTFLLIPLYTSVLTTEEYGTYSIYYTTIVLMVPLLTMDIAEANLRFLLDKDKPINNIFAVGIRYSVIGTIFFSALVVLNHFIGVIQIIDSYWYYLIIMYIVYSMFELLNAYTRGIDRVKDVSISGVIGTFIMLTLNILFLVVFKWGLEGYFVANILGIVAQSVYLLIVTKCWRNATLKCLDVQLKDSMVHYSLPMMGNKVAWWVNDASDKYIVTWICGAAENGIYSVGYKIPSMLSIVQTIFNQAWILSSVKDFDKDDKDGFFSKAYVSYNCVMVFICSIILLGDKIIARILYANEFYAAWQYTPYLLVAVVFGAMSGYFGGIFAAVKKSKEYGYSTIIGAIINVILNIILIYIIGVQGAAIATLASNIVVWVIRYIRVKKYINMNIMPVRCIISYSILIAQSTVLIYVHSSKWMYGIQIVCLLSIILLFFKPILGIIKGISGKRIE